ncbi:hypothetical protein SUGI_0580960 [Cryptomeria japonica]|nr:hypothetical protein SUGI_0580960 [Cryptomeria japonica]
MIILCREFSVVISPVLKMGSLRCVVDPPCVGYGHAREPASGDGSAPKEDSRLIWLPGIAGKKEEGGDINDLIV